MRRSPVLSSKGAAILVLLLLSSSSPRAASAQDSGSNLEVARALFIEGTKLGKEGRWEEARQRYARSLQLKPSPMTRYSLGVAQQATGHLPEAIGSFRAFLADPPTPASKPYREPAQRAIVALERRMRQRPAADKARPTDESTPATSEPSTAPIAPASRTLPLILLGTGGALVAGGATIGLIGVAQASDAPTQDGPEASSARTKGIAGDVLGAVGVATAGAALVLLLTQGRSTPPQQGALRPWLSGSTAGIEVRL